MDGLVRRADNKGRSVGEFLREEIAEVHGIRDVYIGNPREVEYQLSRIRSHRHNKLMIWLEWLCDPIAISKLAYVFYQPNSTPRIRKLFNSNRSNDYEYLNHPETRAVGQPGVNGIGCAIDLAQVLDMFEEGKLCSRPLLDTLREPVIVNEFDLGLGVSVSKGHGFFYTKSPKGDWQYGHLGVGGQNLRTDTKRRITFAYITNGMKAGQGDNTRVMKRLEAALYRSYQKMHADNMMI